jgi:hypothetical protein
MLLLIPEGEEAQSALCIRTMLVYTGKDGKEQLQVNLDKVMEEIRVEGVRARSLRYCAKEDNLVGQESQDPDEPMESWKAGTERSRWSSSCPRTCALSSVSSAT